MKKVLHLSIIILMFLIQCRHIEDQKDQSRYYDYYPQLNKYQSEKPLGVHIINNETIFRLFAPRATGVQLILFDTYDASQGDEYSMKPQNEGIWEYIISDTLFGKYYCYRVDGPRGKGEHFDPGILIADPYAKAVVTGNNYHHPAKGIIIKDDYDWEGDTWVTTPPGDLIIYEMHVRDMTIHSSSGISAKGTYLGLTERAKTGGLDYLLDLGINAVELLPCQEFGNIEIPFKDSSTSVYNTWNPYERNHWGYMTSYFFAPESYYASDNTMEPGKFCGIHGQQVYEFKDMVKTFHKHGIAVIMDVVYNHVSQYDYNPFKYIDKKYYFRLDKDDNFLSKSGCGNDFMTERPMARRLILESIKYWMTEYHIDGFRFDLAYLIDPETCREIIKQARKINPHVYIIAEPWGDGYDPAGFSKMGWAAWNDKFRNAVKGQNPFNNPGYIFGAWENENNPTTIKRYVTGTLLDNGGLFQKSEDAINYLESHDDHTLGDFIRLGLNDVNEKDRIVDLIPHVKLNEQQLKMNKLAALFLFTSRGAIMIHAGQEFARSKIIAKTAAPDTNWGRIDHNSYDKDNETNYINYYHKEINKELHHYYKGLIELRKTYPVFQNTTASKISFLHCNNEFGVGFHIKNNSQAEFIVLMNGHCEKNSVFNLPGDNWDVLVDENRAGVTVLERNIKGRLTLLPGTGRVLIRK